MKHVATHYDALALAEEIMRARSKPLILVSSAGDGSYPFDPAAIASEVLDDADVITITTGPATYALESAMPPKSHVYAGAARSYPVDYGDDPDWRRSILRFPDAHTVATLVDDALSQVSVAQPAPPSKRSWVRAIVERVSGASGNVARLENGERVVIVADDLPAEISLAEALVEGEAIEGMLAGRDLVPQAAATRLDGFTDGSVTLGRIVKVTPQRVYITLHPTASEVALRRRDIIEGADDGLNADVQITDIAHVGQTVRVRVGRSDDALTLSLVGLTGQEPFISPLPIFRGGPPWLREGVDAEPLAPDSAGGSAVREKATSAAQTPPSTPAAAGGEPTIAASVASLASESSVSAVRDELRELRGAFSRLSRELRAGTDLETLDRLRDEASALSAELQRERALRRERDAVLADLRRQLREAYAARTEVSEASRTPRSAWPSADQWVRHEVLTTWAARTIASEKEAYPLGAYAIGPKFIDSLTALDDNQCDKAFRAIVDVVTGRAADVPARQLHRLRENQTGNSPYVVRDDGALCWRVAIEINSPSARRLHYWQLPGGRFELSRVVIHDDVEP